MSHYQIFLNPGTTIPSAALTPEQVRVRPKPEDRCIDKFIACLDRDLNNPRSTICQKIFRAQRGGRESVTISWDDEPMCSKCYRTNEDSVYYQLRQVTQFGDERQCWSQIALSQHYNTRLGYHIYLNADGDLVISWK
jgi:hypothetical protein